MRALIVIVEGQTEAEFIRSVLSHYLFDYGIHDIRPILIPTSPKQKGGLVDYVRFRVLVRRFLKAEHDVFVTSMVDYYGLPNDFPSYQEALQIRDPLRSVERLEKALGNDIGDSRFLPYIQLHEFEAVLFTSEIGFQATGKCDKQELDLIKGIINQYPNPEMINDGPLTAPSRRIKEIIPRYEKVDDGNFIALENGINAILDRCPRFRHWVETLIDKMQGA